MSELCITCGTRPRKRGRRKCGHCAWRAEDREKARKRRREYRRRVRRAAGVEPIEVIRERAARRKAEREARKAERAKEQAKEREAKPWLAYPAGSAERFRSRYHNDPAFAQSERERAIIFRFTNPQIAVKSDPGNHWQLAANRSDGSVTTEVVRNLLRQKSCYLCGTELTQANRSIDHRIALILGGPHTADNLAACCLPCNRKKGGRERKLARDIRENQVNKQEVPNYQRRQEGARNSL